MSVYDDELTRLERRPTSEPCDRAGMWRRSYDIACYGRDVLEARVKRLREISWDAPMTLFYPEPEDERATVAGQDSGSDMGDAGCEADHVMGRDAGKDQGQSGVKMPGACWTYCCR